MITIVLYRNCTAASSSQCKRRHKISKLSYLPISNKNQPSYHIFFKSISLFLLISFALALSWLRFIRSHSVSLLILEEDDIPFRLNERALSKGAPERICRWLCIFQVSNNFFRIMLRRADGCKKKLTVES